MHAASESGSEPLTNPCSMRRACDGPLIALGALMPNHGVLADPFVMPPDLQAGDVAVRARDNPISSFRSPDPPPPRARPRTECGFEAVQCSRLEPDG
jgi:hypothetical protein